MVAVVLAGVANLFFIKGVPLGMVVIPIDRNASGNWRTRGVRGKGPGTSGAALEIKYHRAGYCIFHHIFLFMMSPRSNHPSRREPINNAYRPVALKNKTWVNYTTFTYTLI